jgi:hypothetical protein
MGSLPAATAFSLRRRRAATASSFPRRRDIRARGFVVVTTCYGQSCALFLGRGWMRTLLVQ